MSSRILNLQKSVTTQSYSVTLGEYKLRTSGISETVKQLAEDFKNYVEKNPVYIWIVYADDASGTGITLDSTDKAYIGIYHTREGAEPDLTRPELYSWSKIQGKDGSRGVDGSTIWISSNEPTSSGQSFIFDKTDFVAQTGKNVLAGDVVFAGDYRYVVQSVDGDNVICTDKEELKGKDGESSIAMRIDSSRGNLFKNNNINTILSVNLFYEGIHITTSAKLKEIFGASVHLEWKYQEMDEDIWHDILITDERISDEGFQFRISTDDITEKIILQCNLVRS